jgi:CheY-like chemotaxis protein
MTTDIVLVDDDVSLNGSTARNLAENFGQEIIVYSSIAAAREGLLRFDSPFVAVVDHNFEGEAEVGYDLCRTIRTQLAFGMHVPIIYRTARESARAFEVRNQSNPRMEPDYYLDKMIDDESILLVARIQDGISAIEHLPESRCTICGAVHWK